MSNSDTSDRLPDRFRVASDQLLAVAAQRVRDLSNQVSNLIAERWPSEKDAKDAVDARSAEEAWQDLREHPFLLWVPPVWRAQTEGAEAVAVMRRKAVSAIDRNLLIELGHHADGVPWVRLATGPLHDRPTPEGVDPTTAAGSVDPKLDVTAPNFSTAVIELRNALIRNYGDGTASDRSAKLSSLRSVKA